MGFPDRFLVWVIALLASLEAFGQAAQGFVDGRLEHVILWLAVSVSILLGTAGVDTVKARKVP